MSKGKYKTIYIVAITFLVSFFTIGILDHSSNDPIVHKEQLMPLVLDTDPLTAAYKTGSPIEQRDIQYRKYLAASLKIAVSGASGSGTIVYYDPTTKYAYVASCGHLWPGTKSAEAVAKNPVKCRVITWYKNNEKLAEPKEYSAEVLFWSNDRGYDSSLLRFKPDWVPEYFPIAPVDYDIPVGSTQNSCGCDKGSEVARYAVEIVGYRGNDLVTKNNSPRPGRSGGGMLSNDGYYIGTCWGTSSYGGEGVGYFTPLKSIYSVYKGNGYNWLLEVGNSPARDIPIRDAKGNSDFSKDIIPMPGIRR